MNRQTRFLTALGVALTLTLAARAENPDGKDPGSRPCCKPCGECGRAGVSEGTATNDASYWNFLSGRLEQHVVLSTRHHGLALAERAPRHCEVDRRVTQGDARRDGRAFFSRSRGLLAFPRRAQSRPPTVNARFAAALAR